MNIKQISVGRNLTNCYLIGNKEGKAVVIDPGGNGPEILKTAAEEQLDICWIINTHGHFDHIAANAFLKERTDASIIVHQLDQQFLPDPTRNLSELLGKENIVISPEADRLVEDGTVLKLGSVKFKVIHTPGHSPGSISLYCSEEDVLFSGDTIFKTGFGRTDLFGGNQQQLFLSIEKLLELDEKIVVFPGHGQSTTIGKYKDNIWKNMIG